jgi:hypothetical protein
VVPAEWGNAQELNSAHFRSFPISRASPGEALHSLVGRNVHEHGKMLYTNTFRLQYSRESNDEWANLAWNCPTALVSLGLKA